MAGIDATVKHCTAGLGIWSWASSDEGGEPDAVLACAGDVPTMDLGRSDDPAPALPGTEAAGGECRRSHGAATGRVLSTRLGNAQFDRIFTCDRPVIFAYHGYPWLIHRLTYRRTNRHNVHVRGYVEEGATTTPFDMTVLNGLDRFHLAMETVRCLPGLAAQAAGFSQQMQRRLVDHKQYIARHGQYMPEIRDWRWE